PPLPPALPSFPTRRSSDLSPQSLLDHRVPPKDLFRRNTFHRSHDLRDTQLWYTLNQKVNMIPFIANLHKMYFITLGYFNTNLFQTLSNLLTNHRPSILDRKYYVIQ